VCDLSNVQEIQELSRVFDGGDSVQMGLSWALAGQCPMVRSLPEEDSQLEAASRLSFAAWVNLPGSSQQVGETVEHIA